MDKYDENGNLIYSILDSADKHLKSVFEEFASQAIQLAEGADAGKEESIRQRAEAGDHMACMDMAAISCRKDSSSDFIENAIKWYGIAAKKKYVPAIRQKILAQQLKAGYQTCFATEIGKAGWDGAERDWQDVGDTSKYLMKCVRFNCNRGADYRYGKKAMNDAKYMAGVCRFVNNGNNGISQNSIVDVFRSSKDDRVKVLLGACIDVSSNPEVAKKQMKNLHIIEKDKFYDKLIYEPEYYAVAFAMIHCCFAYWAMGKTNKAYKMCQFVKAKGKDVKMLVATADDLLSQFHKKGFGKYEFIPR